jgi:hypothetical protein
MIEMVSDCSRCYEIGKGRRAGVIHPIAVYQLNIECLGPGCTEFSADALSE